MKKLTYTDEATFKTEELEFSDEHYNIADKLNKIYGNSTIIVRNDRKSLCFFINTALTREERVNDKNIYRITIEKL